MPCPTGFREWMKFGSRKSAKKAVEKIKNVFTTRVRKTGYREYTVYRRKKPSR